MVEFLSAAWIAALDAAARTSSELSTGRPFVVETLVSGSERATGYQISFGPDGASVSDPGTHAADVVLVTDLETAWDLHQGTIRAQDAFARGRLKLRGDPEALSGRSELLAAYERATAGVRAITTGCVPTPDAGSGTPR
jgi:hypothetical protein